MVLLKLKFMNLITMLAIAVGLTSAIKSSDKDVENLRKHLAEIRAIIDEAYNPCVNFTKFACGKINNASGGENYPNDRVNVSKIAYELNRLKDIKLESTRKVKDFLESCMNHQNPRNILQKVIVFKDPTEFRLEKTLGFLKTSGVSTILKAFITASNEKKVRIRISADPFLFFLYVPNEKTIKRNLELLEVNSAERADAEKKIAAFLQKGKSILTSFTENSAIGRGIKDLKNFDWNEYLTELKQLPLLSQGSIANMYVFDDVVQLQKIIDLAHETEPQILRLVTAFELLAKANDTECNMVVDFFRMPLFAELYRLYFTQTDHAFYLDVFKEFEKSYSSFQPMFLPSNKILSGFKEKRKLLESVDQILDGKVIDADYKDVLIEKDNFYQNFLNLKRYQIQKDLSRANRGKEIIEDYLFYILNPVNKNKPVLYHFSSQGHYLWKSFFRASDTPVDNSFYRVLRECLDTQRDKYGLREFSPTDYFEYVDEFAAIKQTFVDFKRYWNEIYDSAHKQDDIFKEFHLTRDQAFFLNLAQKECARVNIGNNIPFRVLLNMKDVSKAFSCPLGTQLNIEEKCSVWEWEAEEEKTEEEDDEEEDDG